MIDPRPVNETVSVVIPCHSMHRWNLLVRAVDSVINQRPKPAEVVVVVDHNLELYEQARARLMQATVLHNQFAPGASGSRNTGIFHTSTPIVALLDDDAHARDGWLTSLIAPFGDPAVVGTGGVAIPDWESTRPAWFPDELLWTIGASMPDAMNAPRRIRNVWALTMAVRRDAFEKAEGFNFEFTQTGTRPRLEDTDLCIRMTQRTGGRWMHVPDAVVDHHVPRVRATPRYVFGRCFDEGRGKVRLGRQLRGVIEFSPERRYLGRTLPRAVGRELAGSLTGQGVGGVARAASMIGALAAAAAGGVVESLHIARRLRPPAVESQYQ